ncbi:hypothetical protein HOE04_03800 [archaeon]|jgi:hypothetical protein|nr:hypothetical protein [archaeon]
MKRIRKELRDWSFGGLDRVIDKASVGSSWREIRLDKKEMEFREYVIDEVVDTYYALGVLGWNLLPLIGLGYSGYKLLGF